MKLDLSIGQRLAIGLTLLLLIFAAMLVAAFRAQGSSARAELAFTQQIAPLRDQAFALERAVYRVGLGLRAYLLTPEEARRDELRRRILLARDELGTLHDAQKSDVGTALYADLAPVVYMYLVDAEQLAVGGNGASDVRAERALALTRERALEGIRAFSDYQEAQARAALAGMGAARDRGVQELATAAVLALLFFVTLAFLLAASIRRPAQALIRVANAFERGIWRPARPRAHGGAREVEPRDELDKVARALGTAAAALDRREKRLEADVAIAAATAASLRKEDIARKVLLTIVQHVGPAVGVLYAREGGAQTLKPLATYAFHADAAPIFLGQGIPGEAARDGRTIVVHDVASPAPFNIDIGLEKLSPRSIAAVPITFGEDVIGVFLIACLRPLEHADIAFLEASAVQVAVGLRNALAHEDLHSVLGQLNEQKQQIEAQNRELKTQEGELQRQDRRRREFLASLEREFEKPVAVALNGLFVLKNATAGSEAAVRAQGLVEREVRHMNGLIEDVRVVRRLSQEGMVIEREPVDLCRLAAEGVKNFSAQSGTPVHRFDLHLNAQPVLIDGDRVHLALVIARLLANVVQFADGPEQRVRVTVSANASAGAVFQVQSNRTAFTGNKLILDATAEAGDLSRSADGGGLGLSVVKSIVALHGGRIEVQSDAANGFAARVSLPSGAVLTTATADHPPQQPSSKVVLDSATSSNILSWRRTADD